MSGLNIGGIGRPSSGGRRGSCGNGGSLGSNVGIGGRRPEGGDGRSCSGGGNDGSEKGGASIFLGLKSSSLGFSLHKFGCFDGLKVKNPAEKM